MEPKQKGALITQQPGPGTRGGGGFVRPRCSPEQPWLGSQKRRPPWKEAAGASRRDWGSNEGPGSIQVPKEGPQVQRGHLLATPSVTVRRGHRRLMRRGTEEHARAWRCTPGTRGVREHRDVPGDTSGRGVSPRSRGGGHRSPGQTFLSLLSKALSLQRLAKRLVRQPQSLSMSYVSQRVSPPRTESRALCRRGPLSRNTASRGSGEHATDERGVAPIGQDTGRGSVHSPTRLPLADPALPPGCKRHSVRRR